MLVNKLRLTITIIAIFTMNYCVGTAFPQGNDPGESEPPIRTTPPDTLDKATAEEIKKIIPKQYEHDLQIIKQAINYIKENDATGFYWFPFDKDYNIYFLWEGYPREEKKQPVTPGFEDDLHFIIIDNWEGKEDKVNEMVAEYESFKKKFSEGYTFAYSNNELIYEKALSEISVGDDVAGFKIWKEAEPWRKQAFSDKEEFFLLTDMYEHLWPLLPEDMKDLLEKELPNIKELVGTEDFTYKLGIYKATLFTYTPDYEPDMDLK